MESLNISFAILTGVGIWKPIITSSKLNENLYNLWRIIFTPLPYMLASAQLARIMFVDMDFDELTEILFIFISILNVCCKSMSFLVRRKELANLANMLNAGITKAHDVDEADIQDQYHQFIRYTVLSYVTLVGMSSGATAILPCFLAPVKYALQLKAWYPYEITNDLIYWCTYVHQALGILIGAAWNATNDTIVAGFMMQTCAQLDLIICRLQQLPENTKAAFLRKVSENEIKKLEEKVVKESVLHHLQVFQY